MGTNRLAVAVLISVVAVGAAFSTVFAQDTHYWNTQYGPRSMLLSGAVIGSVTDMSATYYNPGALGHIEKPELLLSANVYELSTLSVRDGGGTGIDLESNEFNPLPNMLAGAFRKSWLGNNKLAYSFLTRYRFSAEVRGARTDRLNVVDRWPGDEDFGGGLGVLAKTSELWAGLTWARGSGRWVGWGVTTYLSIRNLESQNNLFAEALSDSGEMALYYDTSSYEARVYSLLWKLGLGFKFDPVTLGLTVTTPNVQAFSQGQALSNVTHIGIDMNGDGTVEDGFTATVQEDVRANYHAPLSIGAGAGVYLEKWNLVASAEWFDAVERYDVLELASFVSQETGEVVVPTLVHRAKSVLNYAAGLEYKGRRFGGYLSFNTDFSSFDPESEISVTGFDLYSTNFGGTVAMDRTSFMLGLGYSWGSEKVEQTIDLNPEEGSEVLEPEREVELVYSRLTFMIGFSVNL